MYWTPLLSRTPGYLGQLNAEELNIAYFVAPFSKPMERDTHSGLEACIFPNFQNQIFFIEKNSKRTERFNERLDADTEPVRECLLCI